MRKTNFFQLMATVVALCFLTIGCDTPKREAPAAAAFDAAKAKKEIEAANQRITELSVKGDSVGLANVFTSDAKFMGANTPTVVGRKNIQTAISGMFSAGVARIDIKTSEVWGGGELVVEVGETTYSSKEGAPLGKDKFITVWKKEDGQWKIFRDCSNSDLPLPVAAGK